MRAAFPLGLLSCALSAPILAGQTLSFGLQPAAVTVKPGAQAVVRLTVTGAKGNSAAIALSVSGLPAGIGADFAPKTLNGSGTSELRLRTAAALAAGRYSLQIAAKQGTQAAEQALLLEASPSAEFKLQAGTPVLRLVRNRASGSVKLEDHPEGRTDTALAVESAPSGIGGPGLQHTRGQRNGLVCGDGQPGAGLRAASDPVEGDQQRGGENS
jgi:hypothetical protein